MELDPNGSRPLEGMHGLCGRRFDCFDPVCSAAVGVGAVILPSAGIEFLPREDALISQGHPSPLRKRISGPIPCRLGVRVALRVRMNLKSELLLDFLMKSELLLDFFRGHSTLVP